MHGIAILLTVEGEVVLRRRIESSSLVASDKPLKIYVSYNERHSSVRRTL